MDWGVKCNLSEEHCIVSPGDMYRRRHCVGWELSLPSLGDLPKGNSFSISLRMGWSVSKKAFLPLLTIEQVLYAIH